MAEEVAPAPPEYTPSVAMSTTDKIDDNEEEPYVHDQLPDVEEVRTRAASFLNLADTTHRENQRLARLRSRVTPKLLKWVFWVGLVLMLVAIIILVVGLTRQSSQPVVLERGQVEDFLVRNGIATRAELSDDSSPQWDAVSWLTQLDGTGSEPLPEDGAETVYFVQRYVLVVLFYATDGSNWVHSRNLLTADRNTCGWNSRVIVDGDRIFQLGATCVGNSKVTKLQIPWTKLKGDLPREIGYLTNLDFLALHHNLLMGRLPDEYQLLTDMDYLALHSNQLIGTLPSWLDQLTLLRVIGLGSNLLEGTIPPAFDEFTELVTLGLDNNDFEGDLANLQNLKKMTRLYLNGNSFVARLDTVHLLAMRELEELDLSENSLEGTIPVDFFQFPKLRILDLNDNQLSGKLPLGLYDRAPALNYLALNFNDLVGPIVETISDLNNLTHLDLSGNEFTGFIPEDLGRKLTNLRYLFLADNPFLQAGIPDFSKLTKLEDLSMKGTNRTGEMPAFTQLKNLIMLDFDDNALSGEIPMELSELSNLEYLFLNRNEQLTGKVPTDVQNLPSLKIILLARTSITGNLRPLCSRSSDVSAIHVASADCYGDAAAEVECECCTICCADGTIADNQKGDKACRKTIYYGEIDPIWENSFQRRDYEFTPRTIVETDDPN